MKISIVRRLEDAPEVGDAILTLSDDQDGEYSLPIRDGLLGWAIDSVGGWDTRAKEPPALQFRAWDGESFMPPSGSWGGLIFAPTSEEAVRLYNEAQPFGEVTLTPYGMEGPEWLFSSRGGPNLIYFQPTTCIIEGRDVFTQREAIALHALLGEVISYQSACESGSNNSRVHVARGIK